MAGRMRITSCAGSGLAIGLAVCLSVLTACTSDGTGPKSGSRAGGATKTTTTVDPLVLSQKREAALGLLAEMARTGTPEERANALEALAVAPRRLRPLIEDAVTHPNEGVRAVAVLSSAEAGLTDTTEWIRPLLRDRSARVRAGAILAMRRAGEPVNPSELASMLDSPVAGVRGMAAFVLGELGERSASAMLVEAMRRPPSVVTSAQDRLVELQIAEALVKLGDPEAIQQIRAALYPARPEDLEAAALAAQIIGEVGDEASVDQLIVLTARHDEVGNLMPAEIRLAAAGSLARLGLPRGAFIADEFLASERATLRAQAAYVLGEIGDPERLPSLEQGLADSDGRVRVASAVGVLRLADRGARAAATGGGGQ